jgi:putative ABC transport system permease protein
MNLKQTLQVAWEGITSNKVRSLLTVLGIIIGVAAVIIMMAVSAGTEAAIAEQIGSLGTNLIIVQRKQGVPPSSSVKTLNYEDALAIAEEIQGVTGVTAERTPVSLVVRAGAESVQADVLGVMPGFPDVRDVPVVNGRFFGQTDLDRTAKVAALGYGVAQDLFGDADPVGQSITVGRTRLVVVGVMAEKGTVGDTDYDNRIYVPITTSFEYFTPNRMMGDIVGRIYVQVESTGAIESTIPRIESLLFHRHALTDMSGASFYIQTQQDIIETQEATTAAFRSLLAWVAGVSLLVGGIGIMNIMLVSVSERTREIGIRQAIGARPIDIRLQFLLEALALSLVGGLIGTAAGVGGAWVFGQTSTMQTVVVFDSILLALGSAATVGVFFGYYPANKAAQLDPIEALRHE